MTLVKITLKKESQELYTLYRQEGWYGFIIDKDMDHTLIKRFGTDRTGTIYFGSVERIVNSDIESIMEVNI